MPQLPTAAEVHLVRQRTKVVTRHMWEVSRERIDQHRLNRIGERIYKRRKETVERSFADANSCMDIPTPECAV